MISREIVSMARRRDSCSPLFSETFQGIGADGLQHTKARLPADLLLAEETVIHQGGQAFQNIQCIFCVTDRFDGFERESADEHTKAGVQFFFFLVQEAVAPFKCIAQGLVPRGQITRAAGEQLEAIVQAGENCLGGNSLIRAAANSSAKGSPSRRRQISVTDEALSCVKVKVGLEARARSTNRCTDSFPAKSSIGQISRRLRQVQWRDRIFAFAMQFERDAAAGDDLQLRSAGEDSATIEAAET